jgi:menaquinone-dependent protoporphyrinogen oxidase
VLKTLSAPSGTYPILLEQDREGITQVDVLPMEQVKDLCVYQAVVAGSAIRKSKWLPEAVQFMRMHQATLRHIPFAMFTVCITLAMSNTEQYRSAVRAWVAPMRSLVQPLSEGLFAGKLDFSKLPFNWDTFMLRLTVALGIFPRGDHRDWNAVRAWAEGLKPILQI